MGEGFVPETRLLELALGGDPAALDALWTEARRHQDEALVRRLIRLRLDRGAPLRVRQGAGEPQTLPALLEAGLSAEPIALCEPFELALPWDATRLRLLACDWAEHLAPNFTGDFESPYEVAHALDDTRRAALGLAPPEALATAHTHVQEDVELFTGLWAPADEALAALLGATDPLRPHLAGRWMRCIVLDSHPSGNPQETWEEASAAGLAWLAGRLERYLLGPSPSLLWRHDLRDALAELRDAPPADPETLRHALWGLAWLGLELVIGLGDEEELVLSELARGDTLVLEALVDFAATPRIVAPLEADACWDEATARALAADLGDALEPLRTAPAPLPARLAALQRCRDEPTAARALLAASEHTDACFEALEEMPGADKGLRQRGWQIQARLLLARLLGCDTDSEVEAARASLLRKLA